jgi:hypothetical protein
MVERDDIVVVYDCEWCLCLYCHTRGTEHERPVPDALRRAVINILAAFPEATGEKRLS